MERVINTNLMSPYIEITLNIRSYCRIKFHVYFDIGNTISICLPNVLPSEYWKYNSKKFVTATTASGNKVIYSKYATQVLFLISFRKVFVDTIYMSTTIGCGILLGQNFLLKYAPFIQNIDRYMFTTPCAHKIFTSKFTKAVSIVYKEIKHQSSSTQRGGCWEYRKILTNYSFENDNRK